LTEGVEGGEVERDEPVLAQSCPALEPKAARNRFFHPPSATEDEEEEAETPLLQA